MEILTLQQAKDKGYKTFAYNSRVYLYEDENGTEHLIRDEKWIASGELVVLLNNSDYKFRDKDGIWHLMRDGKEIGSGKIIFSYDNLEFECLDENEIFHRFNKDGIEIEIEREKSEDDGEEYDN